MQDSDHDGIPDGAGGGGFADVGNLVKKGINNFVFHQDTFPWPHSPRAATRSGAAAHRSNFGQRSLLSHDSNGPDGPLSERGRCRRLGPEWWELLVSGWGRATQPAPSLSRIPSPAPRRGGRA